MNNFLRKNKKFVVWFVVVTFIIGGALLGFGAYMSSPKLSKAQQSQTIAMVNKEAIPTTAYYQRLQQVADQLASLPPQQILTYRYQILNSMIEQSLLMQEAKKERIRVKIADKDINDYITKIKKDYNLTQDQLVAALKEQNMSLDAWKVELKTELKDQKVIQTLVDKVAKDVTVTDQDVKNSYEKVDLSNIFISKGKDAAKSKAKAEEALAKIKAGGDFAEVARKYSENSDAAQGGYVGFVTREYWGNDKALADKTFALAKGQISDVIESTGGYHILKVADKKLAEGKDFDSQKAKLKEDMLNNKKSQIQNEWFNKLKSKSKVVINAPELAGYEAMSHQDFKTAIAKFEEAISQNGSDDVTLTYLAAAYKVTNQSDKAIDAAKKAVEASGRWENYVALGQLYEDKGDKANALANYKKASENIAPEDIYGHYQLQSVFTQIGAADMAKIEEDKIAALNKQTQQQAEELKKAQDQTNAADTQKTTTDTSKTTNK